VAAESAADESDSRPGNTIVDTSTRYRFEIAKRLKEQDRHICEAWLERLKDFLPVADLDVFPHADLLDHIPDLIAAIADDLARPDAEGLSSSIVTAKDLPPPGPSSPRWPVPAPRQAGSSADSRASG
jgi:hypothetical protein